MRKIVPEKLVENICRNLHFLSGMTICKKISETSICIICKKPILSISILICIKDIQNNKLQICSCRTTGKNCRLQKICLWKQFAKFVRSGHFPSRPLHYNHHDQDDHHDRGNHEVGSWKSYDESHMMKWEVVHKEVGGCLISFNPQKESRRLSGTLTMNEWMTHSVTYVGIELVWQLKSHQNFFPAVPFFFSYLWCRCHPPACGHFSKCNFATFV